MANTNEEGARSFAALLAGIEDGQLLADLTEELHDLNANVACAAEDVGAAKGELTIKIRIKAKRGGTAQVEGDFTAKSPKKARSGSLMWLTKGNNLSFENPKQTKLPLREVTSPRGEVRDVSENKGDARSV